MADAGPEEATGEEMPEALASPVGEATPGGLLDAITIDLAAEDLERPGFSGLVGVREHANSAVEKNEKADYLNPSPERCK